MKKTNPDPWESRADHLAENDWVVIDDFLPADILHVAGNFLREKLSLNRFKEAGIGPSSEFTIEKTIRSDEIFWLDRERDKEIGGYFDLVEEIIGHLNRLCFLSISGYEFHLAHYPKGSFYKKHLDQFDSRSNRLISVVCYLNERWDETKGGQLRLYGKDGSFTDILPLPGRMVLFKSDVVPHEVLVSHDSRFSITGWLLHQPVKLGFLMG